MTSEPLSDSPINVFPPPWHCKADFYSLPFYLTAAQAAKLSPSFIYSPLEAASSFANGNHSRAVGGLSFLQLLRYKDSPVGPYYEMIIAPGYFDWEREVEDENGNGHGKKPRRVKGRNLRITRIYVSDRHSAYNGRASKFWYRIG
jgi:hypothetical protein